MKNMKNIKISLLGDNLKKKDNELSRFGLIFSLLVCLVASRFIIFQIAPMSGKSSLVVYTGDFAIMTGFVFYIISLIVFIFFVRDVYMLMKALNRMQKFKISLICWIFQYFLVNMIMVCIKKFPDICAIGGLAIVVLLMIFLFVVDVKVNKGILNNSWLAFY
jgi:hypothetical protein